MNQNCNFKAEQFFCMYFKNKNTMQLIFLECNNVEDSGITNKILTCKEFVLLSMHSTSFLKAKRKRNDLTVFIIPT